MSHCDLSKLTHFNGYFDEDSELFSPKYLLKCVNLLGCQKVHSFQAIKYINPKFYKSVMIGSGQLYKWIQDQKIKKIDLFPKSLRPFLRILCSVDDSHAYMQKELLVRSARMPALRFASLRSQ